LKNGRCSKYHNRNWSDSIKSHPICAKKAKAPFPYCASFAFDAFCAFHIQVRPHKHLNIEYSFLKRIKPRSVAANHTGLWPLATDSEGAAAQARCPQQGSTVGKRKSFQWKKASDSGSNPLGAIMASPLSTRAGIKRSLSPQVPFTSQCPYTS